MLSYGAEADEVAVMPSRLELPLHEEIVALKRMWLAAEKWNFSRRPGFPQAEMTLCNCGWCETYKLSQ